MYPGRRWPLRSNQCWADADMMKLLTLYSYPDIRREMPFILRHICRTLSDVYCNRKWNEGKNCKIWHTFFEWHWARDFYYGILRSYHEHIGRIDDVKERYDHRNARTNDIGDIENMCSKLEPSKYKNVSFMSKIICYKMNMVYFLHWKFQFSTQQMNSGNRHSWIPSNKHRIRMKYSTMI